MPWASFATWRSVNIAIALIGLGLVIGYAAFRRRSVVPINVAKEA